MNESTHAADPASDYQHCVAREREAWARMQGLAPGSFARGEAFCAWSEAISRTNAAWRRVHGQRVRPGEPLQAAHG